MGFRKKDKIKEVRVSVGYIQQINLYNLSRETNSCFIFWTEQLAIELSWNIFNVREIRTLSHVTYWDTNFGDETALGGFGFRELSSRECDTPPP